MGNIGSGYPEPSVWSGSFLSEYRTQGYCRIYRWTEIAPVRLCKCSGWSRCLLFGYGIGNLFSLYTSCSRWLTIVLYLFFNIIQAMRWIPRYYSFYVFLQKKKFWVLTGIASMSIHKIFFFFFLWGNKINTKAQLFQTNTVVSQRFAKTLLTKYGLYANIFADKMWVAFAFAKATHIFSAKIPVN